MRHMIVAAVLAVLAVPAWAQRVSDLPLVTPDGTESIPVARGGASKRITIQSIWDNFSLSAINNIPIGATTASSGKFTTLGTTGNATVGGTLNLSTSGISASGSFGITAASTSGLINIRNSNGVLFSATDNGQGTIANYLKALPHSTGNSPTLTVDGTDTNVDLQLSTKGTGIVKTFLGKTFRATHLSARPDLASGTTWVTGGAAEGVSNLYVTGGVTGTATLATAAANYFGVTVDTVSAATNGFQGMQIDYNFGGSGMKGSRRIFQVNAAMTATPGDTDKQYSAGQFNMSSSVNAGGTSGSPSGILYGLNPSVGLFSGATFFKAFAGEEVDIAARTGSSYGHVDGLSVILNSAHAVKGTDGYDGAFVVGTQAGITAQLDMGIRFGAPNGPFPISGTLIGGLACTSSCGSIANSAVNGVDFSFLTFSGNTWNDGHVVFTGDGTANLNAGSGLSLSSTTGFVQLPFTAGIPTGAPTGNTNCAIDTTNGYLNCYYGAAWHKIAFSAGAG